MADSAGVNLPLLQGLIKKDPEAYAEEYKRQYEHFESKLESFRLNPTKVIPTFAELVAFLSQTSPCYAAKIEKAAKYASVLMALLNELGNTLHYKTREAMVNALKLLRSRNQISTIAVLPTFFALLSVGDKVLRHTLTKFIIRDIQMLFNATRDQKIHNELKKFMFEKYSDVKIPEEQARKAARIVIQLYHKRIWTDRKTVNYIAMGTLAKDHKVSMACANFLLGTGNVLGHSDDEDSDAKEAEKKLNETIVSKNTKNREEKLEREKKLAKKFLARRARRLGEQEGRIDMPALDLLDNPEGLCDRMMEKVMKRTVPFRLRLTLLDLISRLAGRHELIINNFYSALVRYVRPSQQNVTKILATAAQAAHGLVPPDDIIPCVKGIYRQFVIESQPAAVITVGLNAISAICERAPLAMDEEMMEGICVFEDSKDKSVVIAFRRFVNTFRDKAPHMLPKDLRGKDASLAIADGIASKPIYGAQTVDSTIPGLELLVKAKALKEVQKQNKIADGDEQEDGDAGDSADAEDSDEDSDEWSLSGSEFESSSGEEGENDEEEATVEKLESTPKRKKTDNDEDGTPGAKRQKKTKSLEDVASAVDNASKQFSALAMETLLTDKDFAELTRLKKKQEMMNNLRKGNARERREYLEMQEREKKRAAGELDSDDESDYSFADLSDASINPDDMPSDWDEDADLATKRARVGAIEPGELLGLTKSKMNKAQRVARMREGKTDQKEMVVSKIHKEVASHSLPESVKRRNKPMAMLRMKSEVRGKNKTALRLKVANLRKHIETSKKKTGGKIKRRRG